MTMNIAGKEMTTSLSIPHADEAYGVRIRLYYRAKSQVVWYQLNADGCEREQRSTGETDPHAALSVARREARRFADQREGVVSEATDVAIGGESNVRLGRVLDEYRNLILPELAAKNTGSAANMEKHLRVAEAILGRETPLAKLNEMSVKAAIKMRMAGDFEWIGRDGQRVRGWPCRETTAREDLIGLRTAINQVMKNGGVTIGRAQHRITNPLTGIKLRPNADLRRCPLGDDDRYERMMAVADEAETATRVHYSFRSEDAMPSGAFRLLLCLLRNSGRRISSIRQLTGSDHITDPREMVAELNELGITDRHAAVWSRYGVLRWDWRFMKRGDVARKDTVCPLAERVSVPLAEYIAKLPRRDAWLFPSPTDPSQPVSNETVRLWLKRMEEMAGVPKFSWGASHPWRRLFRSERAHMPPKLVGIYVGWKVWEGSHDAMNGPYLQFSPRQFYLCGEYYPRRDGAPEDTDMIGGVVVNVPQSRGPNPDSLSPNSAL